MSAATYPTPPATAAPRRRNSPWQVFNQSMTLAWRNIVRTKNNPEALMDVTFMPIIFTVLFVFVFGGAISGNWQAYLPFVLPGILVQTVVFSTMGTGVGLNEDFAKGVFDRFRSLPISRSAPLIGGVLGDTVRYVVSTVVTIGFGLILGFRFQNGILNGILACLLVLAFALCLCWVWAWLGLVMRKAQGVAGVGMLIMFPLTFGSNTFVETSTLPTWMQGFVSVNPVKHLLDVVRYLMVGGEGSVLQPLLFTVLWMIGFVAVSAPFAIRAYRRKV